MTSEAVHHEVVHKDQNWISLELVLKLEIALSNVEESDDSRGFRTGSRAVCSTVCP